MDDTLIHSHYVYWQFGEQRIQLWPPAWWLVLVLGLALLFAIALAVVLIPRMMRSHSAGRDE